MIRFFERLKGSKMKVKKVVALGLYMAFIFSLSGCGAGNESEITTEATASVAEEVTSEEATAEEATNEEVITAEADTEEEKSGSGILPYDGDELVSKYSSFDVTSSSLTDGVWNDIISYTVKGQNKSPELTWEPVEGASIYAIYMIDISMHYMIHWNSYGITETSLPEGWASGTEYIGPVPPKGGTHTYDVYVIALKNPIERLKGGNTQTLKVQEFIDSTDVDIDGNSGNIVAIGHLSGEFTNE